MKDLESKGDIKVEGRRLYSGKCKCKPCIGSLTDKYLRSKDSMSDLEVTKVKVLAFFERETIRHSYRRRSVWVCISMKMLGEDLGISEGKARWATEKLVQEGKLKKQHFGLSKDRAYSYMVVDDEEEEDD